MSSDDARKPRDFLIAAADRFAARDPEATVTVVPFAVAERLERMAA
jgi:hypothetical protein